MGTSYVSLRAKLSYFRPESGNADLSPVSPTAGNTSVEIRQPNPTRELGEKDVCTREKSFWALHCNGLEEVENSATCYFCEVGIYLIHFGTLPIV